MRRGVILLALLAFVASARASFAAPDLLPLSPAYPNFAGVGVGIAPEFAGSSDYLVGGLPVGRYNLGGERFVELYGTYVGTNLLDTPYVRFGPVANYRFGRRDVSDHLVRLTEEIDDTIELGFDGGVEWSIGGDLRHHVRVGGDILWDVAGVYEGYTAELYARYWRPVGRFVDVGIGVSVGYGSGNYMSTFFGVSPQDSARSGLPAFQADAGIQAVRIFPMVLVHLSRAWHVGIGVRYGRLLSDAADSPIVTERGSRDQLIAGIGIGYAW